jgi:aromatic-L-amino-acid decarboxylase
MRSLRLWFLLLDQGVDGLAARVRRDMAHAAWLKDQVDAAADWERLAPVPLQTVCLRHVPAALRSDEAALARHNLGIMTRINQNGRFYLSPAQLKGHQILRVSIGSAPTERRHVEALWDELRKQASQA